MLDPKKIKLLYFVNQRIPGTFACTVQQANMCAAFSQAGCAVTMVRPWYRGMDPGGYSKLADYYGLSTPFTVVTLPSLLSLSRLEGRSPWGVPFLGGGSVLASMSWYLWRQIRQTPAAVPLLLYGRSVLATMMGLWLQKKIGQRKNIRVIFEVHSLTQQPAWGLRYVLHHGDRLITISQALKRDLCSDPRIAPEKILVLADGIRRDQLNHSAETNAAAAAMRIDIPQGFSKRVVYTGSATPGKGVEVLIQAAELTPSHVQFILVGERITVGANQAGNDRIYCPGFVPPAHVALYQACADILVLPNVAEGFIHAYTSPLKLFEYMAAGKPIVASDLLVLREVLQDGHNALLVPPADPAALARAIMRLLENPKLAAKIAANAYQEAQKYTWEKRAEKILNFVTAT